LTWTTVLTAGGETVGTEAANTGMASNSIEQTRAKTFRKSGKQLGVTNLDFNIRGDANIPGSMSQPNSDRAAWVLAGGRSSRMGIDKARANLDGRALALRVADEAAAVCGSVSLVGDPLLYAVLGLPVIADRFPGQGPLAGMEAALAETRSDVNLILACDMPAIRHGLLEELFTLEGDCVVPRHDDGRLEPLCAVYRRRCHSVIRLALETGIRKVTDALLLFAQHSLAIRYVRVSDPAAFANLNTPDEWQKYLG
jgi:molybdopterin-guanine dinucleotide biosynthesis protein A